MARGSIAKQKVAEKIAEAFGSDYIGMLDNKYYVWSMENGERIQIAISMTCPKNPIGEIVGNASGGIDFNNVQTSATLAQTHWEPAEITDEEQANLAAMLERLGL